MVRRLLRWIASIILVLIVGMLVALGGDRPASAYADESTATPTPAQIDGQPGGSGGGGLR